MQKETSTPALPNKVLMMIFRLLSTEDLLRNVSRVSKRFYELATDAAVHIHVRLNDRVRFVAKSFLVFDSNCLAFFYLVLIYWFGTWPTPSLRPRNYQYLTKSVNTRSPLYFENPEVFRASLKISKH